LSGLATINTIEDNGGDNVANTVKTQQERDNEAQQKLLIRAQQGDRKALQRFTVLLDKDVGLRAALQDIAHKVREMMLEQGLGKDNLLLQQEWEKRTILLCKRMIEDASTPLELMLIERIGTCYLAANLADIAAQSSGLTLKHAEYLDKRAERLHHRHIQAIECLARVRRLQIPAMQVNIAQPGAQQLNLATSSPVRG
jgi:hypothetical protein